MWNSNWSIPSQPSWGCLFEDSSLDRMRRKPEVGLGKQSKHSPPNSRLFLPNSSKDSVIADQGRDGDDLLIAWRVPLAIGVFLGLIPIRGTMSPCQGQSPTAFSWFHWRTALTATLTIGVGSNIFFITDQFIKILTDSLRQSAGELVFAFSGVWFYAAGTGVYVFFLTRSTALREFMDTWKVISRKISGTVAEDGPIRGDVTLLSILILGSCVGENILFHFHVMTPAQLARIGEMTFEEFLRSYYGFNKYMSDFFEYHPLIALTLFLFNKLTLYAWNFGDVVLIVLSRAIYGKFRGLKTHLETHLERNAAGQLLLKRRPAGICWKSIRLNFLSIVELLDVGNSIFAPLVWLSYITNIFFVCNQLYIQFSPSSPIESPLVSQIYVIWSFLHLIMRTIAVNLTASKINEEAHSLVHLLQHCCPEEYDMDVRRLEEYLGRGEIGLSGNGCFVITRSFILMIVSAIFTLEVVLLQNSSLLV